MTEKSKKNSKQDVNIAQIQTDIEWIKSEIRDIKSNHLKTIYTKLDCIERKLLQRPSWFLSGIIMTLVGLVATLITYIVFRQ